MTKIKELLTKHWLGLGIIISVFYSVVVFSILWPNLTYIFNFNLSDLNKLGGYLAGAFSPLAFLWLVVGYLMQSFELKLNRISIDRQAEELKLSREIQLKKEKNLFHSNQPIIEINLSEIIGNRISIEYFNHGSRATNAIFSSRLMGEKVLTTTNIDKGLRELELPYDDFENKVKSLELSVYGTKELDEITVYYVDNNNLQQRSQLKIEIVKNHSDASLSEHKIKASLRQYFDGELLD